MRSVLFSLLLIALLFVSGSFSQSNEESLTISSESFENESIVPTAFVEMETEAEEEEEVAVAATEEEEEEEESENENESETEEESEEEESSESEEESEEEVSNEIESESESSEETEDEVEGEEESETEVEGEVESELDDEPIAASFAQISTDLPKLPSDMPAPTALLATSVTTTVNTAAATTATATTATTAANPFNPVTPSNPVGRNGEGPTLITDPNNRPGDKWSAALNAVNEEIMSRAREINSEKKWSTDVTKLVTDYSEKHKKVLLNMNTIRQQVKDLLIKKKQVENAMIQRELKKKIKITNKHLSKIGGHIDHLKRKEEQFSEKANKLKELTDSIKKQLKVLKGSKKKSAKEKAHDSLVIDALV